MKGGGTDLENKIGSDEAADEAEASATAAAASAATAVSAETNAETAASDAEAAQLAAEASAAGVNLPSISGGDDNKILQVNNAEDGYDLIAILDEDDMVSNSNTKPSTQQSIKAYIDAAIAAVIETPPRDQIVRGFELGDTADDDLTVIIQAGTLYHGIIEINKTSNTTLTFANAAHWWDGVQDTYAGGAGWNYIGVNPSGDIRFLGANAADKADTAGNTDGKKLYWFDGSVYWRVVGAVRMDTDDKIHVQHVTTQRGDWIWFAEFVKMIGGGASGAINTSKQELDLTPIMPAFGDTARIVVDGAAVKWTQLWQYGSTNYVREEKSQATSLPYHIGTVAVLPGSSYTQTLEMATETGNTMFGYVQAFRINIR